MQKLKTIYNALLMAQVLFAGLAIFIKTQAAITNVAEDISRMLQVVALVVCFSSMWVGMSLYRKRITAIKNEVADTTQKINKYTAASLIKWAMTEAPCLFCIIGYLLTGNMAFLMLAVVVLFVFAGYAPQKNKVVSELGLTAREAEQL